MKNNKIIILIALLLPVFFTSCENYFGDINVDPDNPTAVPVNVILPVAEARLAYAMGGDASRFTGLFTQHINGVGRQFAVFNRYNIIGSDLDALWSNLYSGVLQDSRQMLILAEENGYNHYAGISKALEAYSFMFLTDMFGDIPYTEALVGTSLLQPAFDSQESVYAGIFETITDAKRLLTLDDGGLPVSTDDIIYGGDVSKWIKFCSVLEARGRLHLATKDASNYQRALDALSSGFTSRDDDGRFQFNPLATEAAPWFQYLEQRLDTQVGESYVALMESLNDPRVATYGFPHTADGDHPVLQQGRNYPLLTFTEAKFIEAEALAKTNGDPEAAFEAAVASSFMDAALEDDPAGYLGSLGTVTADVIAVQKYIAMFNDPEAFNDWRRTGIPALTPNVGAQVPTKLPYAETERLSNSNTPQPQDEIFTKVWWDN